MLKRCFDFFVALLLLMLFIPVLVLIAILVRLYLGSPVFFCQKRPGLNGQPFTLYKFRTMTDAKDSLGRLFSDDVRLTRFGQFLRRTSLDELPQLFNVLIGDISLVGPRPLLMEYLPLYNAEQARRHEVKPGITGWAQVNGRNTLSWEEKFVLDVWYVDNHSIWLDLRILLLTVKKVLMREGISSSDNATMPAFVGSIKNTEQQ